jgi:GGDEF domain-containing protein
MGNGNTVPPPDRSSGVSTVFAFGNVLNKESFLFLLDLEIKRAQRYQNFLSLLSLTFGHLDPSVGKNATISLKGLANLVKGELRHTDIVGQDAGNRLLVMLPYAEMSGAHTVRERLEKILYEYGFGRKGFAVEINEVCFPIHATNFNDLLRMAGNLESMCTSTPALKEGEM